VPSTTDGSSRLAKDSQRRAFWKRSMDDAHQFMAAVKAYPVGECREPLASIPDAVAGAGVDVEFSDTPFLDGIPRIFEVREGLIDPLLDVAREMNQRGWVLKFEDGFRTARMQQQLARKASVFDAILSKVAWETGTTKPDPNLVFRRISVLIAVVPKVAGHMSGCAVDISVLDRDSRVPLDRGGAYLEMSEVTPMLCPFISPEALHRRVAITALMEHRGFVAYPWEFWHYSMGDIFAEQLRHTGKPARYAAVRRDPASGAIEPLGDLMAPLHSDDEIRKDIVAAVARVA
jgi:D-alanyl-D-alanine dipeptidase